MIKKFLIHIVSAIFITFSFTGLNSCKTHKPVKDLLKANVNYQLGINQYQESQFEKAYRSFSQAIYFDSSNSNYHLLKAKVLTELEKFKLAEDIFAKTCTMQKIFPECWDARAYNFFKLNNYQQALEETGKSIDIISYTNKNYSYNIRAKVYLKSKQYKAALNSSKQAVKANPENCESHNILAKSLLRNKLNSKASDSIEKAIIRCPLSWKTHAWVAYTDFKIGNVLKAKNRLQLMKTSFKDLEAQEYIFSALRHIKDGKKLSEPRL